MARRSKKDKDIIEKDETSTMSPGYTVSGEELIKEYLVLRSFRDTLDGTFRDVAWNFMPAVYDYVVTNNHSSDAGRYDTPADAIGLDMINTLASALYSNTVSTGDRWFTLRAAAEDLNEMDPVSSFYAKLTDITLKAIQNSNFSLMVHESLRMASCFGTGIIGSQYNPKTEQLEYKIMRITDCAIAENSSGEIDTLFYVIKYSACQAVDKFGIDKLPKKVREAYASETKRHIKEDYIRCIKPRKNYAKGSLMSKDMPFMDVIVYQNTKEVIEEGGHVEFPFSVHRFDRVEGTPYGRSPAMNGLGTIKMLNRMTADMIDTVELSLQPPAFLPEGCEDVSLAPGAVNQYDATAGGRPYFLTVNGDLNGTMAMIERYQQQLRDIFYVDKFIALENQKNMTATEVVERVNEKIQAIAPVVSRMQSELLRPLIERTVRLLVEAGRAPAIPDALLSYQDAEGTAGNEFKVEYTTRLDAKLAEVDTNNLMMALQEAAAVLAQTSEIPDLDIILNKDAIIKMIFRNHNVTPDATKSEQEIRDIREAAAAEAKAMQQVDMLSKMTRPMDLQKQSEEGSIAEQGLPGLE